MTNKATIVPFSADTRYQQILAKKGKINGVLAKAIAKHYGIEYSIFRNSRFEPHEIDEKSILEHYWYKAHVCENGRIIIELAEPDGLEEVQFLLKQTHTTGAVVNE